MANEFGDDFIVLTTEDGREIELEQLSTGRRRRGQLRARHT